VHLLGRAGREGLDTELQASVRGVWTSDLAERNSLEKALTSLLRDGPAFDALVSNAGVRAFGDLTAMESGEMRRAVDVNLTAPAVILRAMLPGMKERRWGRVILVSSRSAWGGASGEAIYGATKAGLVSLCESVAKELAGSGVAINALCPERFTTIQGEPLPDGEATVKRILRRMDRILASETNGRVYCVLSPRHELVDFRRLIGRAFRILTARA
jgi:NAD(P)-dependent dehydrogenase (short-subunit alcohol dehydrogenase family)